MGGGWRRRAGRGGRRDAAAARTSSESTSASSVFVSSGLASVYDSFSAGKCGRRNLSGLGTDVIDEVEVRTSSTIFSSAALRSSFTGSRTRSTRSSISFCSAWSSSESSATSPERVLILVSAFVGFLEASSSFAFFGGEGGMADADLRNAERSASAAERVGERRAKGDLRDASCVDVDRSPIVCWKYRSAQRANSPESQPQPRKFAT